MGFPGTTDPESKYGENSMITNPVDTPMRTSKVVQRRIAQALASLPVRLLIAFVIGILIWLIVFGFFPFGVISH